MRIYGIFAIGSRSSAAIPVSSYSSRFAASSGDSPAPPCGICRQFMAEFCGDDLPVLLYDGQAIVEKTLGELLPEAFRLQER